MSKSGSIKYIAIYLNEFSDFQFQADEPTIRDWSQIGTRRIWNYRNSLKVISSRTWGDNNRGWYLFEFYP